MVREISAAQLESKAARFIDSAFGTPAPDRLIWIDVAPQEVYESIHPARAFPASMLRAAKDLRAYLPDPGVEIVLVGDGTTSTELHAMADWLEKRGYFQLYIYNGDRTEWSRLVTGTHCSNVDADGFVIGPELTPLEHVLVKRRDEKRQPARTPEAPRHPPHPRG